MFIKHSTSISVIPRKNKNDFPCGILRMRVHYNAVRCEISLGFAIDLDRWDKGRRRMKGTGPDSHGLAPSSVNKTLAEYEVAMETVFERYGNEKTIPSTDQLRSRFWDIVDDGVTDLTDRPSPDVKRLMILFKQEMGHKNNWAGHTYSVFNALERDILAFDPKMRVSDFTEKRLTEFVYFLQTCGHTKIRRKAEDDPRENGLRDGTVEKKIKHLKEFLRWAYDNKHSTCREFAGFKPRLKVAKKTPVTLEKEEIYQLCAFRIPDKYKRLEAVRDVFIFCCFTGLRYSDVQNLKHSNIKKDYIDVTTIKTIDNLKINKVSIIGRILDKYKDCDPHKALPTMSIQKMNDALKELGKMAGLTAPVQETYFRGRKRYDVEYQKWELMSTHMGRRSFISNSFALGIPAEVVKQWTGHSSYQAMKPYIAIASSVKAGEIRKLDWEDLPLAGAGGK